MKMKEQKGITLIALVVTIVVLLILAGITITMLFSDSGIINKAREAAEATKNAQSDTEQGLDSLGSNIELALAETAEKGKIVQGKFAKWTDESGTAIIPGGYCVVKDGEGEGEENKNTIKSGLVISDLAEDTLDNAEINEKKGNQFVWVPVPDASEIYGVDKNGVKHGKLYEFGKKENGTWTTYTEPKLLNWTEGTGVASQTSYREPDKVSYDGSDATYEPQYFTAAISDTMTGAQFKEQLQKEFDSMIESVKRYGGFYIGRYETQGMTSTITEGQKIEDIKPTVKKEETPSTGVNWYYMYQESKNIGKENDNVTSSMIWGCQWDRTLDWIAQTNPKEDGTTPNYELLTDSSSWGNYKNYSEVTEDSSTTSGSIQESGTNTNWQKNHIYDLVGNVREWTLEARDSYGRVFRGGSYSGSGSNYPASYRDYYNPTISYYDNLSTRVTLYVKL